MFAQQAYEAYAAAAGWKSLATGSPLPQWDALPTDIKKAWTVSAAWVAGKVSGMHDWQIPSKDAIFAERIEREAMNADPETGHGIADDLLCELLLSIGCLKSVEVFRRVPKWYA